MKQERRAEERRGEALEEKSRDGALYIKLCEKLLIDLGMYEFIVS